jgi:hypothetical protein
LNGKRAYSEEQRAKKAAKYAAAIIEIIKRLKADPLGVDYSGELEKLRKENPKDRAIILDAERSVYKAMKK